MPRSEDPISVYNGKGLTPVDSRVGALMEAIERQTALYAQPRLIESSYRELCLGRIAVADPRSFIHARSRAYDENGPSLWMEGYDLLSEEPVLVPAGLAGYGAKYLGNNSPYQLNGTNGLASGNCLEEAICHALCELIERDAWTLADLKSRWIPLAWRQKIFGQEVAQMGMDDPKAHPRIDFQQAGEPLTGLLEKFESAGLQPVVRDITSDFGIPCVAANVADDFVPGFPQVHGGMGAHPNATIAAIRALTELAQSRAVDIQGVREDLQPAGIAVHPCARKLQRIQHIEPQRWFLQHAGATRPLGELSSVENDDVGEDIRLILSRLRMRGIERAVVVDFSEPGSPFAVVRVMVPGLEFWALEQGTVGERAASFWRENF